MLLNLFVPPRMKIADGSGPENVASTNSAHANSAPTACGSHMSVNYSSQPSVTTVPVITTVISPFLVQHWLSPNSAYVVLCTRVPTPPGTTMTGGSSLTHTTSFPRDPPTHNGICCDSIHWSVVLHSEHLVSTSPSPSCQQAALTWDSQLVSLVQCSLLAC